ncbi:MAG: hypothetical protein HC828_06800 [Blastochloris sp.]|nr:hypothetical protein [Blastochloris sp.]
MTRTTVAHDAITLPVQVITWPQPPNQYAFTFQTPLVGLLTLHVWGFELAQIDQASDGLPHVTPCTADMLQTSWQALARVSGTQWMGVWPLLQVAYQDQLAALITPVAQPSRWPWPTRPTWVFQVGLDCGTTPLPPGAWHLLHCVAQQAGGGHG